MSYEPKKYMVQTFGCYANEADSSNISGVLEALGFEQTESLSDCDVFIVNTCSVRQKSEDKVYGLGKKLKRMKKKPFVIMAGCMVGSVTGERQRYAFNELKERTPWVNSYINPTQINEIPEILHKEGLIEGGVGDRLNVSRNDKPSDKNKIGYVNISFGCDNFCTYCVVPYARGKEVSRTKEEIVKEVGDMINKGFSHIMLCGQNVNSWGLSKGEKFRIRTGSNQKLPFASLLREIHAVKGLKKLSFMSSNPFDFTEDLVDVLKLSKMDNFIHLPVQSGNNDVLVSMHRRHTVEDYISLIYKIKKVRPDAIFGTDIIVGFPGETEKQFLDTVKLFEQVPFKVAFISIYSLRKGTKASENMVDDVPLSEKKRRHAHLTEVWKKNRPN